MTADKLAEALREIKAYAGNPELVWAKATAALAAHAAEKQEPDRLDAERYRWLRDKADFLRVPEGSPQVVLTDEWGEIVSLMPSAYPRGATLDAAIDAAKEAKP